MSETSDGVEKTPGTDLNFRKWKQDRVAGRFNNRKLFRSVGIQSGKSGFILYPLQKFPLCLPYR